MFRFLNCLLNENVKPFSVNLLRKCTSREQIIANGYAHLLLENKLPLFPNIVIKGKDIGSKGPEIILLGSTKIKRAQLDQLHVTEVVSLNPWDENIKGISFKHIDMSKYSGLC